MTDSGRGPSSARTSRPSAVIMVTCEAKPDPEFRAFLGGEVDLVVLVDNSTTPGVKSQIDEVRNLMPVPCVVIHNNQNLGVARALNIGVQVASEFGCQTVYLLDGDAVVDADFFRSERDLLERLEVELGGRLGAVVPIVTDPEPSVSPPSMARGWSPVRSIITSGTLVRLSTIRAVGGFNEALFVEGVDFDFSARIRSAGMILARVNRVLVKQPFGQPVSERPARLRLAEALYAAFYYLTVLAGRGNSFHTRLSRYSLKRRAEYVRAMRTPRGSPNASGWFVQAASWVGVIATLSVDAVASQNTAFLRLAFETK